MRKTCRNPACDRPVKHVTTEECGRCYQRRQRNGSYELQAGGDPVAAFWRKVDKSAGPDACWPWAGYVGRYGYGSYMPALKAKKVQAHRHAYVLTHGDPGPVDVDHMCHNRAAEQGECDGGRACPHRRCCNPAHLRPATRQTNTLAGVAPTAINAAKTHCHAGHPFAGRNLIITKNGWRRCRTCECERDRKRRARNKGQTPTQV